MNTFDRFDIKLDNYEKRTGKLPSKIHVSFEPKTTHIPFKLNGAKFSKINYKRTGLNLGKIKDSGHSELEKTELSEVAELEKVKISKKNINLFPEFSKYSKS
jgi:hypothetical protein